jgi:hypothetical protein
MLGQSDSGPVVLKAVKWTLATGVAALQQSLTRPTYSFSRKRGKFLLIIKVTSLKNNLHFVKDVPIMYVNVIILVVTVSEKK